MVKRQRATKKKQQSIPFSSEYGIGQSHQVGRTEDNNNKLRRVLRTAFTLSANKIERELKNDVADLQKTSLLQVQLKDKYLRLEAAQEAVSGTLLQLEDNGEEFETDFTDAESYHEKYLEYYTHIDKKLGETVISEVPDTPRKFKLPTLELRKFGGDPKEFLSFWSQFQKIHDDGSIPDEDKMQYLVASV
ncbi:uncharacterized protein TNCV_4059231 [Trichonephila clavipes]|nr:uncharacterized protein TNCV_4059231 [Trichonephila clavipes]